MSPTFVSFAWYDDDFMILAHERANCHSPLSFVLFFWLSLKRAFREFSAAGAIKANGEGIKHTHTISPSFPLPFRWDEEGKCFCMFCVPSLPLTADFFALSSGNKNFPSELCLAIGFAAHFLLVQIKGGNSLPITPSQRIRLSEHCHCQLCSRLDL